MEKIPTSIAVVAAALVRHDDRVLLQQRPPGKHHSGLWEFPGGKVEGAESQKTALVRELEEELGIVVAPADLHLVGSAGEAGGGLVISLYICRRWEGEPRALDAAALAWAEPSRFADFAMPPLDVPLAKALRGVI